MRNMFNNKIGDPSSEFGMPDGGERFCRTVQQRVERHEQLWSDFVAFMIDHGVTPDELRTMFTKYYSEYLS